MISINNVHKRSGKQVVLNGVNCKDRGWGKRPRLLVQAVLVKSVLLKLIMGIMQPDSGEIWIGDDNITRASSESERNRIRARLGVLFQAAALFDSLTVYENVAFPLQQRFSLSRRTIIVA